MTTPRVRPTVIWVAAVTLLVGMLGSTVGVIYYSAQASITELKETTVKKETYNTEIHYIRQALERIERALGIAPVD
jgi:hypothetical protein